MGKDAGSIAFYAYVIPFLISTVGGSIISALIIEALKKTGTLKEIQK
jgi:predicted membrane protein